MSLWKLFDTLKDTLKLKFLNFKSRDKNHVEHNIGFTSQQNGSNNNMQVTVGNSNTNNIYLGSNTNFKKNAENAWILLSEIYTSLEKIIIAIINRSYNRFNQDIKSTICSFEKLRSLLYLLLDHPKIAQQIKLVERIIENFRKKPTALLDIAFPTIEALMHIDQNWHDIHPSKFKKLKKIEKILLKIIHLKASKTQVSHHE